MMQSHLAEESAQHAAEAVEGRKQQHVGFLRPLVSSQGLNMLACHHQNVTKQSQPSPCSSEARTTAPSTLHLQLTFSYCGATAVQLDFYLCIHGRCMHRLYIHE